MSSDSALPFSVASMVEDLLQQHGNRLKDLDLESRKAEEEALRRNEAAGWLRKMVGVVVAKDLTAEPSEEEFMLVLRSGIILCHVLNKIQPGAVPKVIESPRDSLIHDGAPLMVFQSLENVRNFLVAAQELGLPVFEASDLEKGGKSSRVVDSVLALKSYSEWKQKGGNGVWKFGGATKPTTSVKPFVRKNSEPFTNSLSRTLSVNEKSPVVVYPELDSSKMSGSHSLSMLIRAILYDKKPEEVPKHLVESVLSKIVYEFQHCISSQHESMESAGKERIITQENGSLPEYASTSIKTNDRILKSTMKEEPIARNHGRDEKSKENLQKCQTLFDKQEKDIQELKHTLHTTKASIQLTQMKVNEEFHNLGMHIHSLVRAASSYHKVFEENRRLYNEVQDLKGSIRVYCRVRPFFPGQSTCYSMVENLEDGTITISTPSKNGKGCKSFSFNKVFGPSAAQVEVFSDMQPLVRSVLDGFNVCIFAYGQTGSGKTYTMSGPKDLTEESLGVNYRALSDLFHIADQRKEAFLYDVSVQMIEIYNEQVRDLLVTDGRTKRLEIHNSSRRGLSVPDANLVTVSSTSDVIDLMNLGQRNRVVGATTLNDRSSRSHSCLTVHVQGKDLASGTILRGCMHLVDLAGSERVHKSEVTGDRLKEAQHINRSLSALGDVIASLAQKNNHIPYRNSKLTQLLQDSLGGQAKTLMFVHISPEAESVGETISTLKFAERVATVELGAARANKDTTEVKELKEQISSLKMALARKEQSSEPSINVFLGSSEKNITKSSELSPFHANNTLADYNGFRQPMNDVGNLEFHVNSTLRQKKQSFDLDEIQVNSPRWPPMNSPGQNYGDDNGTGSGEWVDKVMVNKQDATKTGNFLDLREAENRDDFYQKYMQDFSATYPEKSFSIFMARNQFNFANIDDIGNVDAATNDSSEPDLPWQLNDSKITSLANGIGSTVKKHVSKPDRTPEFSKNMNSCIGPSPSKKIPNGTSQKLGRRATPTNMKRKDGHRN